MSTSYDIRCLDCNETARLSASYSPIRIYTVMALIQHAAEFAALAPVFEEDSDWRLEKLGVHVPVLWFAKHAGHHLRAISEYGEINGQCGKRVMCPHCKVDRGYCKKDIDHEGDCKGVWEPEAS